MIRYPRLPLVGDPMHALMGRVKAKTKTFLRRETQDQVGAPTCLPLVGPERSQIHQKGTPIPAHLPAGFQAHPSMRICSSGGQRTDRDFRINERL
jgi:hypothetical protein